MLNTVSYLRPVRNEENELNPVKVQNWTEEGLANHHKTHNNQSLY